MSAAIRLTVAIGSGFSGYIVELGDAVRLRAPLVILLLLLVASNLPAASGGLAAPAQDPIKVLIIDGVNNHDWESTTAANRATLEQTARFDVDVSTSPRKRATRAEWEAWRPDFSAYDVVVSNFNDDCEVRSGCNPLWSAQTMSDLETFVRQGGGFVSVHAADNHDAGWAAYNEMIGVGGWGGRRAGASGSLLRNVGGDWIATSPNEGLSGEHGELRPFLVIHDRPEHPILAGLPTEWMHAPDELYSALRGPAKNVEVLAHAYSRVTDEAEPMLMLVTYGAGTVFHLPMGHYNDEIEPYGESVHCVGFQTVLARGTEFVATGAVTIGVPASFPGTEEPVAVDPEPVRW
ncbi:MAG TPA: ThuA domain-containing protein [Acidobacteriota bacterium]|nr:ThuA domain-containing protein [Acidobacteriota bacterium]